MLEKIKNKKGFTLVELIVYVGILSVSAGILSFILQTTVDTHIKESERNTVSGQLTFATQTIQRLVRESSVIDMIPGEATSTLKLKMSDSDTNYTDLYTIVYLEDGKMYLRENSEDPKPITNNTVNVDSLSFTKMVDYPSKDTVQIDIAMTGVAQSGGQVVTRALRSAVSRASAVTFDSDLIPGADNTYQVGNSSYKWQNANFSGDVSVDGQVDAGQLCISGDCKSSWSASGVSGSGTANYITKWTGSGTLGNSFMYDDGTNIGIGIATPSSKLDVYNTSDEIMRLSRSTATSTIFKVGTDSAMVINNNGVDTLTLDSGNIGIGTTNPVAKLEVAGKIKFSGDGVNSSIFYGGKNGTGDADGRIDFYANNASNDGAGFTFYGPNYNTYSRAGALEFVTYGTAASAGYTDFINYNGSTWSRNIRITKDGSLGVGTINPGAYKLYVNGTTYFANNVSLVSNATVDGYDISDYGPYWVYGAGTNGQVWKSDGVGRGYWGTDEGGTGGVSGSGVAGYLSKWSGSSSLGYSNIYEISSGYYGIGTTSGSARLNVGGAGPSHVGIYGKDTYTLGGYGVYGEATGGGGGSGIYGKGTYGVEGNGSSYDFYASGSGTNYGPFTGAHDVLINSNELGNFKKGMIVSSTGETQLRYDNNGNISISSTLPKIKLSSSVNDSNVLGVFIKTQEPKYDFWYKLSENEKLGIVNALGEGRVLVTNINGDINSGDYITTSNIPGYGQKQNDDLLHSYTLGKAIENVDWDSIKETVNYNGKEYKYYLIGVIYVSG